MNWVKNQGYVAVSAKQCKGWKKGEMLLLSFDGGYKKSTFRREKTRFFANDLGKRTLFQGFRSLYLTPRSGPAWLGDLRYLTVTLPIWDFILSNIKWKMVFADVQGLVELIITRVYMASFLSIAYKRTQTYLLSSSLGNTTFPTLLILAIASCQMENRTQRAELEAETRQGLSWARTF